MPLSSLYRNSRSCNDNGPFAFHFFDGTSPYHITRQGESSSWQKKRHRHRACVQAKTVQLIACKVKRKKGGVANNIRDDFWEPLYDFRFSDNQDSQRRHTEEITVVQFTHMNSKADCCWWLDIGVRGRIKTGGKDSVSLLMYFLSIQSYAEKSHILREINQRSMGE